MRHQSRVNGDRGGRKPRVPTLTTYICSTWNTQYASAGLLPRLVRPSLTAAQPRICSTWNMRRHSRVNGDKGGRKPRAPGPTSRICSTWNMRHHSRVYRDRGGAGAPRSNFHHTQMFHVEHAKTNQLVEQQTEGACSIHSNTGLYFYARQPLLNLQEAVHQPSDLLVCVPS
jgi:hypothetical protein